MGLASRVAFLTGQKAVWWKRTGTTETGDPIFDHPEEISVRWEDRNESFLTAVGEEVKSRAVVYPDRELSLGDMLRSGSLEDIDYVHPEQWASNTGLLEVRGVSNIPTLRGRETLRIVYL